MTDWKEEREFIENVIEGLLVHRRTLEVTEEDVSKFDEIVAEVFEEKDKEIGELGVLELGAYILTRILERRKK